MTRQRVLLVEDEMLIAMAMEQTLEDFGFEVIGPFSSVPSAMEAAMDEPLDLAVLDMNLRGTLVFPVAEVLRDRGVPIIFCSGYADETIFPSVFSTMPRIAKPCSPGDVRSAIERFRSRQTAES